MRAREGLGLDAPSLSSLEEREREREREREGSFLKWCSLVRGDFVSDTVQAPGVPVQASSVCRGSCPRSPLCNFVLAVCCVEGGTEQLTGAGL